MFCRTAECSLGEERGVLEEHQCVIWGPEGMLLLPEAEVSQGLCLWSTVEWQESEDHVSCCWFCHCPFRFLKVLRIHSRF